MLYMSVVLYQRILLKHLLVLSSLYHVEHMFWQAVIIVYKTATCLRISDIFTYLFRYLLIHSITYKICTAATAVQVVQNCSNIVE